MAWLKVAPSVILGTRFEHVRTSWSRGYGYTADKWRCTVCGRDGYGSPTGPSPWSESCRRGHAPCPDCGRILSIRIDGQPRRHARCPNRIGGSR